MVVVGILAHAWSSCTREPHSHSPSAAQFASQKIESKSFCAGKTGWSKRATFKKVLMRQMLMLSRLSCPEAETLPTLPFTN